MTVSLRALFTGLGALLAVSTAWADFAAVVSPPRFDIAVEAGKTTRHAVDISHAAPTMGSYRFYTADWSMSAGGEMSFSEALQPGSCRRWVAIERHMVSLTSMSKLRYRFEVAPPADTPPTECRFALMVEAAEPSVGTGSAGFPISGCIAVIVYVRVGAVQPQLRIENTLTQGRDGGVVPALRVTNTGSATGRFVGFLTGRDASGRSFEFSPDSSPILPGMTRVIGLQPLPPVDRPNDPPPAITTWPLAVKGTLEVEGYPASRQSLDASFSKL
jgi:hypothetical protein